QPELTRDQLTFWLERFRSGDPSDPKYRETFIEVFVSAVYVYDDHLRIVCNFTGDSGAVTYDFVNGIESYEEAAEVFDFEAHASTKKAKGHPLGCPFALLWSGADEKSAAIFSVFGLAEMTAVQAGKEKLTDFAARAANVHDSRRSTK
ncbi:MAG: hypothetical protein IIX61_06765, partial [Loktanella sp.]|nr:hypothetical protein [Loktanella sp.]